jgi:hypothetical protein
MGAGTVKKGLALVSAGGPSGSLGGIVKVMKLRKSQVASPVSKCRHRNNSEIRAKPNQEGIALPNSGQAPSSPRTFLSSALL